MGKASSSKKVARAARAGGRTTKGPKRQLGYPLGIAAIVIVGVLVVLFARNDNKEAAAATPTIEQHWHAAYGIYVCDAFIPPLTDQVTDTTGLHTHGDGVAHIHPFNSGAAGNNATLANWGKTTGITFTSDGFTTGGTTYDNGYDCSGQPANVSLYVWPADDTSAEPRIYTGSDIGKFHFDQDRLAVTLAVVPDGTDVPRPESVPELDQLSDVAGATSTTSVPATRDDGRAHDHRGSRSPVKAVVLVGGFGTRLRPLTSTTPKQMLPIVDRPMIERVVGVLGRHGVTDAVLALGYRPDAFIDAYPDGQCAGVALHYAVEPEPLDTAGAVRFAATYARIDDTFIVVNGDVLTDLDVGDLWRFHHERGAEGSIALTPVDDPSRYGVVPIDDKGRVTAFVEKPKPGTAPTNWINAGTYVLEPSVLERIPTGRKVSIERETFPGMVTDASLYALHSDAYWVDAGTPNTYVEVQLDIIDGVRGEREAAVHASSDIHPTAVVDHSVVMAGTRIGEHSVVRDSIIMPGARLDPRVLIDGSVIGPGARVGEGAVLSGMTVIGERYEVRAGAHLDGARLPEGS